MMIRIVLLGLLMLTASDLAAQPSGNAPDPFRGFGLQSVALSTDRPDSLAAWYVRTLGFQVRGRTRGVEGVEIVAIERDGITVDIIRVPGQRPRETPVDPPAHLETQGLRNLVFWVDDLEAANRHLEAAGVTLIWRSRPVEGVGTSITNFRDPDGNLIALWARPAS